MVCVAFKNRASLFFKLGLIQDYFAKGGNIISSAYSEFVRGYFVGVVGRLIACV